MTMDPEGELCGCGKRGCWETQVGPRAVLRRVRQTLKSGVPSALTGMAHGDLECITLENVLEAARQEDPVALHAIQEVGERLGIGVANLVNVFNPELIVLGGALNLASPILLPIIERMMIENTLAPNVENVRMAASAHGIDAPLMGAVALVLDDILREPL